MASRNIHFVTGRLAEQALRRVLEETASDAGWDFTLQVLPISVAALMTPDWIAKHIQVPDAATEVMLPGYCQGDRQNLEDQVRIPVVQGPRDLGRIPGFLGHDNRLPDRYGDYDIQIIAEINHAPRRQLSDILSQAERLSSDGADIIDIGCEPGDPWAGVADCIKALRDNGMRVSIDSFHPREVQWAADAGAELILSVNSSNRAAVADLDCEVVVVPDDFSTLCGLDETIEYLSDSRVPFRIDPILEPIGCGFARSLQRYSEVRKRYPDAEMMMGTGNLTELTDCDSAAVNVLLLGFCQELGIRSVLTTQVINWARTSVRECDLARRLVHLSVREGIPPKRIEPRLVMLRDDDVPSHGADRLKQLASEIKDSNYRLFAEDEQLHLLSAGMHIQDEDAFALFQKLLDRTPRNLDASHSFYLGFEMAKAVTAMTLGKEYRQDEALDWGMLTRAETSHRLARNRTDLLNGQKRDANAHSEDRTVE